MGHCARAGACGGGRRRHPPSLKSPNAILELSDANFARMFGVISTGEVTYIKREMLSELFFVIIKRDFISDLDSAHKPLFSRSVLRNADLVPGHQ